MTTAHETPRIASNILPFVRSPASSREAFDLAEWTARCIYAGYAAGIFTSLLCAATLKSLAEAFDIFRANQK